MNERITKVFGKDITYKYDVDWKQKESESRNIFAGKPCIKTEITQNHKEICNFSGEPYLIDKGWRFKLHISEDEEVTVEYRKFRADLNEIHLFTDKVMNETHLNKEGAEDELNSALECFNKQMIESNEKLKDYCDIHALVPSVTDCVKLFKLVYGHDNYEIVNGKMQERQERKDYYTIKADNSYITAIDTSKLSAYAAISSEYCDEVKTSV